MVSGVCVVVVVVRWAWNEYFIRVDFIVIR